LRSQIQKDRICEGLEDLTVGGSSGKVRTCAQRELGAREQRQINN
jgi:hypothetical protein